MQLPLGVKTATLYAQLMIQLQPLDFIQGGYRVNVAGSVCRPAVCHKDLVGVSQKAERGRQFESIAGDRSLGGYAFQTNCPGFSPETVKAHKGSTPGGASDILFRSQRYTAGSPIKQSTTRNSILEL